MNLKLRTPLSLMTILLLSLVAACSERDITGLDVARARIEPLVFDDNFGDDVYPQAFMGTDIYAVNRDSVYVYDGTHSLRISVPPEGSALGGYAGGVLTSVASRDLADFNALTFYARSSVPSILNEAGFGNDNTGTSQFGASRSNISLSTDWSFVVIPIPSPEKLIAERGLFMLAEGWEDPAGHNIWIDEIRFAQLGNITDPFAVMPSSFKEYFVGATAAITGTYTRFSVDGGYIVVNHSANYFDYNSTDSEVARVVDGEVRIVGAGTAAITAKVDTVDVAGSVVLTGYDPPAAGAEAPDEPASEVISLFSDAYTSSIFVDTWNPHWGGSTTEDADYAIGEDHMKMYSSLNYVGIDFLSNTVDLTEMTHLHLDVFAPAGTNFGVKVVAFDGNHGDLLDQKELSFNAGTTPAFTAGQWSSLDIPLADFQLGAPWDHIGQLVVSTSDARLVLIDNIYWFK